MTTTQGVGWKRPVDPAVTAEQVRVDVGLAPDDLPVDLEKVAEHLEIKIYYARFSNERISGMIIIDPARVPAGTVPGKGATIFIKQGEYPPRARFTVAHEIGHFKLGHINGVKTEFYRGMTTGHTDPDETAANEFAAELLMPEIMFTQLWQGGLNIEELTLVFAVSAAAVSTRAKVLNLKENYY